MSTDGCPRDWERPTALICCARSCWGLTSDISVLLAHAYHYADVICGLSPKCPDPKTDIDNLIRYISPNLGGGTPYIPTAPRITCRRLSITVLPMAGTEAVPQYQIELWSPWPADGAEKSVVVPPASRVSSYSLRVKPVVHELGTFYSGLNLSLTVGNGLMYVLNATLDCSTATGYA